MVKQENVFATHVNPNNNIIIINLLCVCEGHIIYLLNHIDIWLQKNLKD